MKRKLKNLKTFENFINENYSPLSDDDKSTLVGIESEVASVLEEMGLKQFKLDSVSDEIVNVYFYDPYVAERHISILEDAGFEVEVSGMVNNVLRVARKGYKPAQKDIRL